ncbi:MAG: M3 family peptidase, partial [Sphingomicrobium sp.]
MISVAAAAQTALPAAQVSTAAVVVPNNILLVDWKGPYQGVPPWDQVKPEQFDEAYAFAIAELEREAAATANNPEAPTFANTIEAMERGGARLEQVGSIFGVMTDNMSSPAYQALDKKWSPKLSAAFDKITLDPKIFARVETLYNKRDSLGLDAKQLRVLTRTYDGFVRRGAKLDATQKAQVS